VLNLMTLVSGADVDQVHQGVGLFDRLQEISDLRLQLVLVFVYNSFQIEQECVKFLFNETQIGQPGSQVFAILS